MLTTDTNQFTEWYNDFTKKYQGFLIEDFATQVDASHTELRKFLGGINKQFEIELGDLDKPCDFAEIDELTQNLAANIPQYFDVHGLKRKDFAISNVNIANFTHLKWPKHISVWMSKAKVDESVQKTVGDILARLGGVWKKNKTEAQKIYTMISTDPVAFARIGHFSVDSDSCFQQKASNQSHKYILGISPDSFVFLVSDQPLQITDDEESNPKILARCWGFFDEKYERANLNNLYYRQRYPEGNILQSIKRTFDQLFGTESIVTDDILEVSPLYLNKGFRRSFSKTNPSSVARLKVKQIDLSSYIRCMICKIQRYRTKTERTTDGLVCIPCAKDLLVCQHSQLKTFHKALNEVYNEKNKIIHVCPSLLSLGCLQKMCN
jgi:hypothetical protein